MFKHQNNQMNNDTAPQLFDLYESNGGKNDEEKLNKDGIFSRIQYIEGFEKKSTESGSEINQLSKGKPKPIEDVDLENSKNFLKKKNYFRKKNQQNPIYDYLMEGFQNSEIRSKDDKKSSKYFMSKTEYQKLINEKKIIPHDSSKDLINSKPNDSQTYRQATLIAKIRISENKIIAVYKELNGNNIYAYEYTIGNAGDANDDWFFPNLEEAYSHVYNYLRQNMNFG